MSRTLVVGSRGSKLALWQAEWARQALAERSPGTAIEVRIIRTLGDQQGEVALDRLQGKGFFVKEIEDALLAGKIDLAVHSLKDLPGELPAGLALAACPEREDPRDALVSTDRWAFADLPRSSRVATGSPRRVAQLRHWRADLEIVPIRGNIDTRVRRLLEGRADAMILAVAGLRRLGLDVPWVPLDLETSLPAVGQGALGIETRADDAFALAAARRLNHPSTMAAVRAERAFLAALGGGCRAPIAALAAVEGDSLQLRGLVASLDGSRLVRRQIRGEARDPDGIGSALAAECIREGAAEMLRGDARSSGG
jgi:hydroxymethylbilane synthase